MNTFIHEDFLLHTTTGKQLYHDYAKNLPIIDYHCHLSEHTLQDNKSFPDLHAAWLSTDPYKWKAMRHQGISEAYCTGQATPQEKFNAWAKTVPTTLGSPLFHWTQLELFRYFGITTLLSPETAQAIWTQANATLNTPDYRPLALLKKMRVEVLYTTNDPTDTLTTHHAFQAQPLPQHIIRPTFRPDKALAVENPDIFNTWVDRLAHCIGKRIGSYQEFLNALRQRHQYFHHMGCRMAHHAMESFFCAEYTDQKISLIFGEIRAGNALNDKKIAQFKTAVLHELCLLNHQKQWVQQFHIGVLRQHNTRMTQLLKSEEVGFDAMADKHYAKKLALFLDQLDQHNHLAKTILYDFNPKDQDMLAAMSGMFQEGALPGKIQTGTGWWFLGQQRSIEQQLDALSNMGLLCHFIGISSATRSILSYPRHEYFRRVLCNWLGRDMEQGLIPADLPWIGRIVQNICYYNAKRYFGIHTA